MRSLTEPDFPGTTKTSPVTKPVRCRRCQGHMISDYFLDFLSGSGEMEIEGWRCLNCGDITDPVIMRHHQLPASTPAKSRRRWGGAPRMYSDS